MNKQEYKLLSEEIMTLTANSQFQDAADIADRIDWRKVRSFSMLMKISELYQLNRRYEDALELMLLAYDHNPKNRDIVYSLCELYIILGNHVKALEFLALYKRMAPNDPGVYILQYKFQELTGAAIEDQIQLLEEFTRKDYREEWVYQLAYLYHRMGLGAKCVETCDELLNWFKEGPFVIKTLELKMLHAKLKPEQEAIYNRRDDIADEIQAVESDEYTAEKADPELNPEMNDVDFHVKTIDMGKFNTMNLQKALAESMRELMGGEAADNKPSRNTSGSMKPMMEEDYMSTGEMERQMASRGAEDTEEADAGYAEAYPEEGYETGYPEEGYEGEYPEEGYEGEYPEEGYPEEGYEEGYPEENYSEENYEGEYPEEGYSEDGYTEEGYEEGYSEENYSEENYEGDYSGDTYQDGGYTEGGYNGYEEDPIESVPGELASEPEGVEDQTMYFNPVDMSALRAGRQQNDPNNDEVFFEDRTDDIVIDNLPSNTNPEYESVLSKARAVQMEEEQERMARIQNIPGEIERRTVRTDKPGMDNMFYLGDDGQLGLAVPAHNPVEKQITGQIHINDYLSEWERTKRRQRAKQDEELHRNLLERTGPIFQDYEERNRNGLIEELEREERIFADKYQADDIELRSVDEISVDPAAAAGTAVAAGAAVAGAAAAAGISAAAGAAAVTAAGEKAAVDIMGEAAGSRSIWEEVEDAIKAEKTSDAGTIGLVDAAVAGSSDLLNTREYGNITEIVAETAPEPAAEETVADTEENGAVAEAVSTEAQEPAYTEQTEETAAEEYAQEGGYAEGEYAEGEYAEGEYAEGEYADGEYYEGEEYYEDGEYYEGEEYYEDGEYYEGEEYYEDGEYYEEEGYEEGGVTEADQEAAEDEEDPYAGEEKRPNDTADLSAIVAELRDTADDDNWGDPMNTEQINEISGALEADADRVGHETVDEMNDEFAPEQENRLSSDEQKLFADFLYSKKMRTQLLDVIDKLSLASYVGNVIITGENEDNMLKLGKNLIKEIQMIDANFVSARIAKISGHKMNRRDIPLMLNQLANGALMIDHASEMSRETLETMAKTLETMSDGLLVIMIDKRREMDRMLEEYEMITGYFNARIDIAPMNNNALVEYAKKYAYSLEYKIDEERGVLALHQRISELQIGEHNVTTKEVEDIVDAAIDHSKRKRIAAYFQILSGKRYDYEDMIILREKDFLGK